MYATKWCKAKLIPSTTSRDSCNIYQNENTAQLANASFHIKTFTALMGTKRDLHGFCIFFFADIRNKITESQWWYQSANKNINMCKERIRGEVVQNFCCLLGFFSVCGPFSSKITKKPWGLSYGDFIQSFQVMLYTGNMEFYDSMMYTSWEKTIFKTEREIHTSKSTMGSFLDSSSINNHFRRK